ncbi:MAG: hypothetical protein R3Y62_07885 [Eubacteriales bacterium]
MNRKSGKKCPYQTTTLPGCCRGCSRLMEEKPAVPVLGEAAFTETTPVSKTDLETFLENHPRAGTLRIQAFRGNQVMPVPGVDVTVSRDFDGKTKVFFRGKTNESGIIDPILLPGAKPGETLAPEGAQSTATYSMTATHPDYETLVTVVDIFQDIKTVQPVALHLNMEGI